MSRRVSRQVPSFSRPKVVSPLLAGFFKGLTKVPTDLDFVSTCLPVIDISPFIGNLTADTYSDTASGAVTHTLFTVPADELWFFHFLNVKSTNIDISKVWLAIGNNSCYIDENGAGVTSENYQLYGMPIPSNTRCRVLTDNDVGADSLFGTWLVRKVKVQ